MDGCGGGLIVASVTKRATLVYVTSMFVTITTVRNKKLCCRRQAARYCVSIG